MTRRSHREGVAISGLMLFALLALTPLGRAATVIRHTPVDQVPSDAHPEISAIIESDDPVASVRLFFRAAGEPDFHYVEMGQGSRPGTARGVLPIPQPGTAEIEYYIVASTGGSDSAWTRMHRATTTSEPVPDATYRGETPEIWIGRVGGTGPDLPAGFQLVAVAGVLRGAEAVPAPTALVETPVVVEPEPAETTISDEVPFDEPVVVEEEDDEGGLPVGPVVAVSALAAAGAGVAVLTGSDSSEPTGPDSPDELSACFTVAPTVIPQGGSVQLNASCSSPDEAISRYRWDLGNGQILEGQTVTAAYMESGSFQILLTVSNAVRSSTASRRIEVLEGPPPVTACITADPASGRIDVGDAIRFDGSCSQPDGALTSYRWELGDGRTRDGRVVSATYAEAGEYIVRLTVTDGEETHTTTFEVTVEVGQDLKACFLPSVEKPFEGSLIELDASCSTPGGRIRTYEWDLGDGTRATGRVITKSWETAGTYTIKLTVGDGQDTNTKTVEIEVVPDIVVACFEVSDSMNPGRVFGVNQTADFDASCSAGRELRYDWDFGDTTMIIDGNVMESHAFAGPGAYSVKLTVTGLSGTREFTRTVDVQPKRDLAIVAMTPPTKPGPTIFDAEFMVSTSGFSDEPGNNNFPVTMLWQIAGGPNVAIFTATAPGGTCGIAFRSVTCTWNPHPDASTVTIHAQLIFLGGPPTPFFTFANISAGVPIIDENPGNNSASLGFTFPLKTLDGPTESDATGATVRSHFTSRLDVRPPDGSVRGRISQNESGFHDTDNSMPFRHEDGARVGENRVKATRLSAGPEGRWHFDFSETPSFEPGSIRVVNGQVISRGPRLLVLRTSGSPGELIEFTYRLSSGSEVR